MAKATKKKSDLEDFVPMKRTRAMLAEVWDHWRSLVGHSPDTAKRMMTAAIDEMHKTETEAARKMATKKNVLKKKIIKKVTSKKTAIKKKIK